MTFAHLLLPASLCLALLAAAQQDQPTPATAPSRAAQLALEQSLQKQRASLEKQRQAIQLQWTDHSESPAHSSQAAPFIKPIETKSASLRSGLALAEPSFTPSQPQFIQLDCPRLDSAHADELISSAARKQSLSPDLLRAVMKQESGFKPCAVSNKGAQGLMQLMPATARELHVNDAFDPIQNVQAGAAYLRQMLDRYQGDLRLALVGYNAGPGRADLGLSVPLPLETQNYIESIFADLPTDSQESKEDLAPADTVSLRPSQNPELTPPVPHSI